MSEHIIDRKIRIEAPQPEVFRFFADAENLETICPPELRFRILTPKPITITKGTLLDYRLTLYGIPFRWQTLISQWDPPNLFIDESLRGPYKQWIHQHSFSQKSDGTTIMRDLVKYRLPLEPIGDLGHWLVRRELNYIFDFREKTVLQLLNSGRRT